MSSACLFQVAIKQSCAVHSDNVVEMPEILLELFSEEIPACLQRQAADDFKKLVTSELVERGLTYEGARSFVTPRRLVLGVMGLPVASAPGETRRKGPRVGAPEQAISGFLRATGLNSIAEATIQPDSKKGDFYVAVTKKPAEQTKDVIADMMPNIIQGFPWPKSMRWGRGKLGWIRPLRAINATYTGDMDEVETIPFEVAGIRSGNCSYGHRFMAPAPIEVTGGEDFVHKLEKARVVPDLDRRMEIIRADADTLAFAHGHEVVADPSLLEEVAGLVEWPVVLAGSFDERFLSLPDEVVITAIRSHQKCFCLRNQTDGKLANRFVLVSNLDAPDGGNTIVAGNERVIRARLADARFFYDSDLRTPLEDRLPRLDKVIFHEKLGTQSERVARLTELARDLAPLVGAESDDAARAAQLAKADLVTDMVFEFPELQGSMGRYYALAQGEKPEIADAVSDHYRPTGPDDAVPAAPVSIAVALADKLDILTGFWAIGEKPTGSKDPFALRRAALGVIRISLENQLDLNLRQLVVSHLKRISQTGDAVVADLLSFIEDRLSVQLRAGGLPPDVVDAVLGDGAPGRAFTLPGIVARINELVRLTTSDDGKNLVAAYRRTVNILKAEEKKDGRKFTGLAADGEFSRNEEEKLFSAINAVRESVTRNISNEDFAAAIKDLSLLCRPVDAFFENVLVNDENESVRAKRLGLLVQLRDTMNMIADFSRLKG